MKIIPIFAAAALALTPIAAQAGGLAAAVEEPMMDMDKMAPSGGSISGSNLLPLLLLAFIAAAASGGDSGTDES